MTEAEWRESVYTWGMFAFLRGRTGKVSLRYRLGPAGLERKQRLFLAACCRRVWPFLTDGRSRRAVDVAEQYVDREATGADLAAAFAAARAAESEHRAELGPRAFSPRGPAAAVAEADFRFGFNPCMSGMEEAALGAAAVNPADPASTGGHDPNVLAAERAAQAALIRDIFGNPFRPVTFCPLWLTSTAIGVAQQMYDARDFGAMPILADALQDAGCEDEQVLAHCRGAGPHARGCWVVDGVLGKGWGATSLA